METSSLTSLFPGKAATKALASLAKDPKATKVCLTGLPGSSAAMAIASLPHNGTPLIVIGDDADDAGYLYHDLSRLIGDQSVAFFPSAYKRDIKYGRIDPPSEILRTEALSRWHTDKNLRFVVTYPEAMAEKVAPEQRVDSATLTLSKGKETDMANVKKWLIDNGFTRQDYVYLPGQFAIRGSIVDIFGYADDIPCRIDFFGDEIDSIRTFDTQTQLSTENLNHITIAANVASDSDGVTLISFAGKQTRICIRSITNVHQRISSVAQSSFSTSSLLTGEGDPAAMDNVVDPDLIASQLSTLKTFIISPSERPAITDAPVLNFHCSPQGIYHKNFDLISSSFSKYIEEGYTLYILSDSSRQLQRLRDIFADRHDNISFIDVDGTLHEGFADADAKICVFTDHQIFDRYHRYNLQGQRARSGKVALSLKELGDISVGDYIVHLDHGIGRFGGLLRTNVNGHPQEMIKLIYQNNDFIFVSIHSLHKLSKYRGKEATPPQISRLGTGAWNKLKERTKSRLKDIARDLIKLYAARKDQPGHQFPPDSYLQQQLEASFVYEDTPDQLRATLDVKKDMESARPMDRLICGDVGFGKTEVAIRAAFKAATDSKQTALLVPTTVLAYQHYVTFTERLKEFPVRVEYLSRARTAKQTRQILADLADGKIDILIGTHKIIGKNVKFHDLGLLIIDEEQKFGVAVKERLKQMKVNVDTLTMSATPIPRTLQFSLMGARDLSSIQTPPPNRHPIITSVDSLSDEILAEALNFELSRGGQVFIVNNRIEGLYDLQAMVKRVVPDARTLVAHGQMPPEQLEQSIIDFANHDYDILLSTTIIESGIDMPNVNTIIVNNAQNFGLSELHQLRGRVGRSNRKAFCYLMVPPATPLSDIARRRLQAIESFSELGSGIHIAMQDLDIRGAGNLLGAEQSGFIADLGYETYQKILREAVSELALTEFPDTLATNAAPDTIATDSYATDCVIESDLELMLPADYVPGESERISLYRRLDSIETPQQLEEFTTLLRDRFGAIPSQAEELLLIPMLRRDARRLGIEKVALKQGDMYIYFVDESNKAYYQSPMFGRILSYLAANPTRVKIRQNGTRRSFSISGVDTVKEASSILKNILSLDSI